MSQNVVLGDTGATHLGPLLGHLESLDLSNTGLTDAAAEWFAGALPTALSLVELQLERNHIRFEAASQLVAAAAATQRPMRLNLEMLLMSEREIAGAHADLAEQDPEGRVRLVARNRWFNPDDPQARR